MPPAAKSKSKDKSVAKAAKEHSKASSKLPSVSVNSGNGAPASAYNPISGTFHTLDSAASGSSALPQQNGRFRTIDETDNYSGSSLGTIGDFDSASNNGSCSGESEDQKEKTMTSSTRLEPVPGCDNDKREKIRQKNEKKHQRQKERRAQELHERCSGYLMSRKLEALAQQLVAMGFSSEQATMALIQNEGRLEESVTWLFEGGEESKEQIAANIENGVNLKIDITDEFAKIADMELRFKCTKQEVERAIVACEGDLEKAEETLKAQKQEPKATAGNLEEPADPVGASNFNNKIAMPAQNPASRIQTKGLVSVNMQQQRRDEKEFDYTKSIATEPASQESLNRNLQTLKRIQPKSEWGRPQNLPAVEKRWSSATSAPSVSYPLPSPLQVPVPPTKSEARYVMASNEAKANLQAGTLREPVIVMQRSVNGKQNLPSTSLSVSAAPPATTGWYSNGPNMEMLKMANSSLGYGLPNLPLNVSSAQQFPPQNYMESFISSPMDPGASGWSGSLNSAGSSSLSLAMPSSLGLFTGWGSSRSSSSPVDWSNGGSTPRDYTSIDWSVDTSLLRQARKNHLSETWPTMFMGAQAARPVANGGVYVRGIQDSNIVPDTSSSAGAHDWTSPFAGKDLFRVPRQFVTSPSL